MLHRPQRASTTSRSTVSSAALLLLLLHDGHDKTTLHYQTLGREHQPRLIEGQLSCHLLLRVLGKLSILTLDRKRNQSPFATIDAGREKETCKAENVEERFMR